jgi:Cft2 family RNA processing exonuclease
MPSTPLTLTELLLVLVHMPSDKIDKHLRSTVDICHVGRIPYNYIADVSNTAQIKYILKKINSPLPLPHSNSGDSHTEQVGDDQVYCTRETVDLAARLYAKDLETYGYTMDKAYEACEKYGVAHPPKPK